MPRTRSRGWGIVLVLGAALVAALALFRWVGAGTSPATLPFAAARSAPLALSHTDPTRAAVDRSSVPAPGSAREPHAPPREPLPEHSASTARPTPGIFDFATLSHRGELGKRSDERFATNERFTEEDLHHPERYFELAEQMPELNRPEERRDALAFFLAYREQLSRDLEVVGQDEHKRQEMLATLARYDSAIARLQKLVDTEGAK